MASIKARVGQQNVIRVIASNSIAGSGTKLSDISDIDISGRADKFVMVYNAALNKYVFVDPDQILVAAAATVNTSSAAGLPGSFIDALDTDQARANNIDLDGGTW